MIKSIVRRSLARQEAAPTPEPRAAVAMPNSKVQKGDFYNTIIRMKGKAKVCIVRRVGGIGDVLMCTPTLRQLKQDFPETELTFAIDMHSTQGNVYYELVKNASFIDRIIDARFVQHSDYNAVVDISSVCIRYEHSGLPVLNRIDIFARACGIPRLDQKRSWYAIEEKERAWAQTFIKSFRSEGKKIVVLHTASMEGKRCWPPEKYIQLLEQGLADKLPIHYLIIDFNKTSSRWSDFTNCTDISFTTVRQMGALIGVADLFIGPDSGPMHLAGAVGTNSIIVFGSIPPTARINYYPTHEAVRLDSLSCIGCWYAPCPYNVKCMRDLDSRIVFQKMRNRLNV